MPERLTLLDKRYSQFKPASMLEQRFEVEKPRVSWEDLLEHILDNYDQKLWRIEGSAAVALYHPKQIIPRDIDIFTPSTAFAEQFGLPPGRFDVRTTEFWLEMRGLPVNTKNIDYLMDATFAKKFRGKTVLISAPSVVAFSKRHPYFGLKPREKDLAHLAIMNVRESSINRVYRKLLTS